jgi:predicted regulator of Ras-like GTPase activity (Roadblock/LC7/MglB family)
MLDSLLPLGVQQAVLTSGDGLVIDSTGTGHPDAELLAAELASLLRSSRVLIGSLEGDLQRFSLATQNKEVLGVVFNGYCIGAIVERNTDRKSVGTELMRIASKVGKSL